MTPALLAFAGLALAGCMDLHAGVGPSIPSRGQTGVQATAGIGVGWSFHDDEAVYVGTSGGVVTGDHARGILIESLSWIDYNLPVPVRLAGRAGVLFGRDRFDERGRPLVGAAVAVLPWHGRKAGEHAHDKIGDIFPVTAMLRGLGVELAVDALTSPTAADPTGRMVTLSLVGELATVFDR
jgi:hypothetical protein